MERDQFDELVEQALEEMPEGFKRYLRNVEIAVRNLPSESLARELGLSRSQLMGIFIGVPRTRRQPSFELPSLPERIELYQQNIERVAETPEEVKHQVRLTLRHEIGHYFGLSERDLQALEG